MGRPSGLLLPAGQVPLSPYPPVAGDLTIRSRRIRHRVARTRKRRTAVRIAIGDFARMTHLSIKALRHYHEVGVLVPAEVDPSSGYRFYRTDQVPVAQV